MLGIGANPALISVKVQVLGQERGSPHITKAELPVSLLILLQESSRHEAQQIERKVLWFVLIVNVVPPFLPS